MDIQAIHHVAIIVSDYAKSRAFYVDLLQLPVLRENYQPHRDSYKLDLQLGDAELEIFSFADAPARVTNPEALGLRHLAFKVADFDQAVTYLHENGVQTEPIRTDEYTNKRMTFFRDPDGLPLELHE